jgi:hypothetical protein
MIDRDDLWIFKEKNVLKMFQIIVLSMFIESIALAERSEASRCFPLADTADSSDEQPKVGPTSRMHVLPSARAAACALLPSAYRQQSKPPLG